MITSDRARKAFDLSDEPESVRNRYGRHCWGQRALMARRLVEAGVSFVTVVMENPYQSGIEHLKQGVYNWDSHAVNCHIWDDLKVRLPIYDQAVTALIEDIYQRGMDRRTLVLVTGRKRCRSSWLAEACEQARSLGQRTRRANIPRTDH
jgi:hypothetical protein